MKYLVIGCGGVGGSLASYLYHNQKDVDVIARGNTLNIINSNGLTLIEDDKTYIDKVKVYSMEEYNKEVDVIFICVKYYSINSCIEFIKRIAKPNTIIIPLLNVYQTAKVLKDNLVNLNILQGCIYITAHIKSSGVILKQTNLFKIVFGDMNNKILPIYEDIKNDLISCGIDCILSNNIACDAYTKFSFISAFAACGAYFDVDAATIRNDSIIYKFFNDLLIETIKAAKALNIKTDDNILELNLKRMANVASTSTASLVKDLKSNNNSEVEGLIYFFDNISKEYNLNLHNYTKVSKYLKDKGYK